MCDNKCINHNKNVINEKLAIFAASTGDLQNTKNPKTKKLRQTSSCSLNQNI